MIRGASAWAVAVLLASCQAGLTDEASLPQLDEAYFRCRVQPVLTKSCAQLACHGDARRFFHVFGRNRLRLGISRESERNIAMSDEERAFNFAMARAFVDPDAPEDSFLLLKPLEGNAGGYYHEGAEIYGGGDVYLDVEDRDYETLLSWVQGATADPSCEEPGSNL